MKWSKSQSPSQPCQKAFRVHAASSQQEGARQPTTTPLGAHCGLLRSRTCQLSPDHTQLLARLIGVLCCSGQLYPRPAQIISLQCIPKSGYIGMLSKRLSCMHSHTEMPSPFWLAQCVKVLHGTGHTCVFTRTSMSLAQSRRRRSRLAVPPVATTAAPGWPSQLSITCSISSPDHPRIRRYTCRHSLTAHKTSPECSQGFHSRCHRHCRVTVSICKCV